MQSMIIFMLVINTLVTIGWAVFPFFTYLRNREDWGFAAAHYLIPLPFLAIMWAIPLSFLSIPH